MNSLKSQQTANPSEGAVVAKPSTSVGDLLRNWWPLATVIGLILVAFNGPLSDLAVLATGDSLYSHVILIPFASGLLVWLNRIPIHRAPPRSALMAGGLAIVATGLLLIDLGLKGRGVDLPTTDHLALTIGSFLGFSLAACAWFFDRATLRRLTFPLAFLVFMIPFPVAVERGIETLLQHGSAAAAHLFFKLYGTPILAHGLIFELPGFRLAVAPECSGIRSSLVLFIVSLAASWLFLKTPWKRSVLVLAVIPLALLRNGLRVFVIGQLCVDVGPHMIDSYIHREGGPIFFALSLIPLFVLLYCFWRSERVASRPASPPLAARGPMQSTVEMKSR